MHELVASPVQHSLTRVPGAQRQRDQVRGWASDPTIHSTQLLDDARHAIEFDMVRNSCLHVIPQIYVSLLSKGALA